VRLTGQVERVQHQQCAAPRGASWGRSRIQPSLSAPRRPSANSRPGAAPPSPVFTQQLQAIFLGFLPALAAHAAAGGRRQIAYVAVDDTIRRTYG
jgi:hypothetical protein